MTQEEHRRRVLEWVRVSGIMNDVQRDRMNRYLSGEVSSGACRGCGSWERCTIGKDEFGDCWYPPGTIRVKEEREE